METELLIWIRQNIKLRNSLPMPCKFPCFPGQQDIGFHLLGNSGKYFWSTQHVHRIERDLTHPHFSYNRLLSWLKQRLTRPLTPIFSYFFLTCSLIPILHLTALQNSTNYKEQYYSILSWIKSKGKYHIEKSKT